MHKEIGLKDVDFVDLIDDNDFRYDIYAEKVFGMPESDALEFTNPLWDRTYHNEPINCAQRIVYYLINGTMPDLDTEYQHLTLEDFKNENM